MDLLTGPPDYRSVAAEPLERRVEHDKGRPGEVWNLKQHLIDAGSTIVAGVYMVPIEWFSSGFSVMLEMRAKMWTNLLLWMGYGVMVWREAWMWNFGIGPETPKWKKSAHEFAMGNVFALPVYLGMRLTSGDVVSHAHDFNENLGLMLLLDTAYWLTAGPIRDWYYERKGEPPTLRDSQVKRENYWVNLLLKELW